MLQDKRILLGITGGIAAYKAVYLLRTLQKAGADVKVIATPSALHFVGIETLSALSRHEVAVHVFQEYEKNNASDSWTKHIDWGHWADLFVIAPCTANTLAKIAHGLSNNMLTATVLAARCPLLICPTMDGEMYSAPAVQSNLQALKEYGYQFMEPEEGYLASGLSGKGRLPEINDIVERIQNIVKQDKKVALLSGKNIVVTGGPTREYIDAVRFISNPSSGKMGLAVAKAAYKLGADVTFIHGPISIDIPSYLATVAITSTADMLAAVKRHKNADGIIMAAAVSDFTPQKTVAHKIKKDSNTESLQLKRTDDILAWLGENRPKNEGPGLGQTLVGFAMETENLIKNAKKKLRQKNIDWIAANTLKEGQGFQSDYNVIHLINKNSTTELKGTKTEIAQKMLELIFSKEQNC